MKTLDSARVRGGRGVKRRGPPIAGAGGGQTMEQGQATLHLAIPRMLLLLHTGQIIILHLDTSLQKQHEAKIFQPQPPFVHHSFSKSVGT